MLWIIFAGTDISAVESGIKALEKSGEYKKNPTLADSLARLYMERCEYRATLSDCDRAVAIYEKYVKDSHVPKAKALMRKAEVQKGKGQYQEALATYREAIGELGKGTDWEKGGMVELTTNIDLLLAAVGNYYLMEGYLALNHSKYDEALRYFDAAVKYLMRAGDKDLDLARAYHGRGVAYCRLGKGEEAVRDLKEAVSILKDLAKAEPNNEAVLYELGMAYYHLGNAYLKSGKRELAAEAYEKAAAAFMGVPGWEKSSKVVLAVGRTYIKHAEALHKSKKFAEAVKYYKKGIKHLKLAGKLCRKDRKYCPTKEELRAAGKHLKQAKGKKEYK